MESKISIHPTFLKTASLNSTERVIVERWIAGTSIHLSSGDALCRHLADIGINKPPIDYSPFQAAVGRILDGWYEGEFTVPSTAEPSTARRSLPSKSLFTINWATSGPGVEWPAHYDLFLLSRSTAYVVVMTADIESFGYRKFALGRFSTQSDVLHGVEQIIVSDWNWRMSECNHGIPGVNLSR